MVPVPAYQILDFFQWVCKTHPSVTEMNEMPEDARVELARSFAMARTSDFDAERWRQSLGELFSSNSRDEYPKRRNAPDAFVRYRTVPLHAILLYTSQDAVVSAYLQKHWNALDRQTGDLCDLHPSAAQLEDREDAYSVINNLHLPSSAKCPATASLPGIYFWTVNGDLEYVPFGASPSDDQITQILRRVFDAVRANPTIAAVRQVMQRHEVNSERKILILAANPKATDRLRLNEEMKKIEQGLERSKRRDQFVLLKKLAVTDDDLRRALLDHEPEIVHFSGHGAGAEGLAFENEQGETHLISGDALADLFKLCAAHVKCVVLNACYSEQQAEAIAQDIDYVIGMKRAVGDQAAIKYAVGFYDALGAGKAFQEAFQFGVNAIQTAMIPEHLTPVLKKKTLPQEPHSRYWKEQASRAADFVHLHHFEAHRGAILWCPTVTAVFANDGDDPVDVAASSRIGAPMLRERLISEGLTELAVGRAQGGSSWCILVRSKDVTKLFDLAWEYLPKPNLDPVYVASEKKIAMDRVWMLRSNPVNDTC